MGLLDTLQGIQGKKEPASFRQFDTQIAETERQIMEQLAAVGRIYLEQNQENYGEEYAPYLQEVSNLMEQKKELERNKLAAQGLRLCQNCNQSIPLDSAFCNKCGAKMEPIAVSSGKGKHCPSCGAAIEPGSAFCTECGMRLG